MIEVLLLGDSRDKLRGVDSESVDSVVTDPPYELGFMGKKWDATGVAYDVVLWREMLRLLKPGGHLLAFGGTRTYHRMTCAIEDAGFEIRDSIHWIYGTGFPKSLDVSKAIDHSLDLERELTGTIGKCGMATAAENYQGNKKWSGLKRDTPASTVSAAWEGWGTALKPAHEPVVCARKPLVGTVAANVLEYGTGGLNIDGCRIDAMDGYQENTVTQGINTSRTSYEHRRERRTFEPAVGIRWPANVIFDEDAAEELGDNVRYFYVAKPSRKERDLGCGDLPVATAGEVTDREEGSAGLDSPRAGAGRTSGGRNTHAIVKPVELMRYLVRLVTPPGGIVLDPFLGSGTTGMAAKLEGFGFVGIEREEEYLEIARRRIAAAEKLDDHRRSRARKKR